MLKHLWKVLVIICLCLTSFMIVSCKKETYYVVYRKNNEVYKTVAYKTGEQIDLSQCEEEGMVFEGWYNGEGDKVITYKMGKGDVTLYARFSDLYLDITFYDGETIIKTDNVKYNSEVTFPEDPVKEGYDFIGWSIKGEEELITKYVAKENIAISANFAEHDYLKEVIDSFTLPESTNKDLTLVDKIGDVSISYKVNDAYSKYMTSDGTITRSEFDMVVPVIVTFTYNGDETKEKSVTYKVKIEKYTDSEFIDMTFDAYKFNDTPSNNKYALKTNFSTEYHEVTATWRSANKAYVDDNGNIVDYPLTDMPVTLVLELKCGDVSRSKTYDVTVKGLSSTERFDKALETFSISPVITSDIYLPEEFKFGVIGTWESSNENILTSNGIVEVVNTPSEVTLVLTLKLDPKYNNKDEVKVVTYNELVNVKNTMVIVRSSSFNTENFNNVELSNGKLVLMNNAIEGTYESDEISISSSLSIVPSWAAVTDTTRTVEFFISARVNGTWSKYISYCPGGWGRGLYNKGVDDSDNLVKLSTDEFIVKNSLTCDAVKFKVVLRRKDNTCLSPVLSLVSFALEVKGFTGYTYDISKIPTEKVYDVPKLCQNVVPTIGGSICSATSTTMLLKNKGLSFAEYDTYEHRYIAGIVKDYGNNIYGNWVYNVVTMGSYGFDAYVERMYSLDELVYHLATVGPCALSVKGTMTSDVKSYTTNGHLIVAVGYKYEAGVLSIICNDPNVSTVRCTYSETVMKATWRNIAYVIE